MVQDHKWWKFSGLLQPQHRVAVQPYGRDVTTECPTAPMASCDLFPRDEMPYFGYTTSSTFCPLTERNPKYAFVVSRWMACDEKLLKGVASITKTSSGFSGSIDPERMRRGGGHLLMMYQPTINLSKSETPDSSLLRLSYLDEGLQKQSYSDSLYRARNDANSERPALRCHRNVQ